MSKYLPRLRSALDIMPSPVQDRPGLVLRDPLRYSEDVLLIPQEWIPVLSCLDGNHTELDVQTLLVRQSGGELVFSQHVQEFVSLLKSRGFLETEEFEELQRKRHAEFRESRERLPAHAGGAYPEDPQELRDVLDEHFNTNMTSDGRSREKTLGVGAPHVSLEGAWDSYAAAYGRLGAWSGGNKTVVILGTSHYGQPDRFGLTAKTFVTPLGPVDVDEEAVDFLATRAPDAVTMDDYCHVTEHSIEFQVLFLRYRLGAPVKILPILCGPFLESLNVGNRPERNERLAPFFGALAELASRREQDLVWVLGIDLSHMGRRYGDPFAARAGAGPMIQVESQDRERLARVCDNDMQGFLDLVQPQADGLKWCGFTPLYTFLASLKPIMNIRGRVLQYEQWNIDPESVVTFAGLEFFVKE